MDKSFIYKCNNKEYMVEVTYKKMKNIRYRFRDNKFLVSCPRFTSFERINNGLNKHALKMINKGEKELPFTDDYCYIFGVKVNIRNTNVINFSNGKTIQFKNKEDLKKKLKILLKEIIESRQRYYEFHMKINPLYKVVVKDVKSIYGSNSKKMQSITYALKLVHYDYKIIDSIIVHELAHDKIRNHSKQFYDLVNEFYPDYKFHLNKLTRGIYK